MKILLIGYSKIAQKRVIPALIEQGVTAIDVASRSRTAEVKLPATISGERFDNYEAALTQSQADVVYVSTTNNTHATWTEAALKQGFHVVVDKPAFLGLDETNRLLDLAHQQNRCLAEATTYSYHPQIEMARQAFAEVDSQPTRLVATFSFPPLPPDNFRWRKHLGGGALWDLGSYAVTPGRLFFGEMPQQIYCQIGGQGDEVEQSFSLLATYSGGRTLVGHFGFDTGYRNQLDILGPHTTLTIDRVFTTPADFNNELHLTQHNQASTVKVPAADQFALFFADVFQAIKTGQHQQLAQNILTDATVLHQLRQADQNHIDH